MVQNPWCIQVEFVQGCNRRCIFCGIRGIASEKQKGDRFISLEQLIKTFTELNGWLPKIRVEVGHHGEPTLHPKFLESIAVIRTAMPTAGISVQSNTESWITKAPEFIEQMFQAGVNLLILNAYKVGLYEWWVEHLHDWNFQWTDYYYNNPNNLSIYGYRKPSEHTVLLLDDLAKINSKGIANSSKTIRNSAGNSDEDLMLKMFGRPKSIVPLHSKCSKVYREIILNWDGTIPVCCQDWNDVQLIGDNKTQHIQNIWLSDKFNAIRELLFRHRRDLLEPCKTCDDPTTRTGLLKSQSAYSQQQ